MTLRTLAPLCSAVLAGCTAGSSRDAKPASSMTASDSVVAWARGIDSVASAAQPVEFKFPSRSTEGGAGRVYRFADSSVRIDVDDFGETGKNRKRFYAHGMDLRLAVSVAEKYDRPMSGIVVKTIVDSTWFTADTAIRWHDSVGVDRVQRDSMLRAHGAEVFAEYVWSIRMAGTKIR